VWLFFGYIIHFFVVPLNKIIIPILGFPLGFYMAAQGSLIVFRRHAVHVRKTAGKRSTATTATRRRLREDCIMATQTTGGYIRLSSRISARCTASILAASSASSSFSQSSSRSACRTSFLGYLFVFFTLAVYAVIGVMTRTAQVSEYYVAGRRVPAFYNGMATGATDVRGLLRRHGGLAVLARFIRPRWVLAGPAASCWCRS